MTQSNIFHLTLKVFFMVISFISREYPYLEDCTKVYCISFVVCIRYNTTKHDNTLSIEKKHGHTRQL